jgi:predicted RecB family nuclease
MQITSTLFDAYLKCPTKCFLRSKGEQGVGNAYAEWVRTRDDSYRNDGIRRFQEGIAQEECVIRPPSTANLKAVKWHLAVDFVAQAQDCGSSIDMLERIPPERRGGTAQFIPIRFVFNNKLILDDRLLLGFDARVLSELLGHKVDLGKIIHGDGYSTHKVRTARVTNLAGKLIKRIADLLSGNSPPVLRLNRHCAECEFQACCRRQAIEKDDLSLLAGMNERELKKYASKGIFTVTQLSHTFRPRRRPKRFREKRERYHHALKALAIRENKIHVIGTPELKIDGTPVYLDVEGLPDRDFYYLIGIRVQAAGKVVQHSFWADGKEDERKIWTDFLAILAEQADPVLIHYGSFETTFLKRMCARYGEPSERSSAARAVASPVNLLSIIFAQIYFPCNSNGLKDVAKYLGFTWSDRDSSGLQSILWRFLWEGSGDPTTRETLVRYNAEDCEALALVTRTVTSLVPHGTGGYPIEHGSASVVLADSIESQKTSRWRAFASPVPGLEYINAAAHWDYQRDRVYARTREVPNKPPRPPHRHRRVDRVDAVVTWPVSPRCPQCGRKWCTKGPLRSRTLQDLVFGRFSVKRRCVKYVFQTYRCRKCRIVFGFEDRYESSYRYGWDVVAYFLYQIVDLRIPQMTVVQHFNRVFGFSIPRSTLNNLKVKAAGYYAETKQKILDRIVRGNLVHADETRANIKGKSAYVWVLTNLHEVVYIYADTREGEVIQELLADFKGVLVSDFYAAYDSIDCPQQKCLIHLMRDLNDEILTNPFDEELKQIVAAFAGLVKPIVETVDRHGLKKHFLNKHQVRVERFYREIARTDNQSETALKCKQRFEKNRTKLFTFLSYNGIPWNNNNAEHAIKAFARLRDVLAGTSTAKGVDEYLTLLSVCQTCKYRGLDFLAFLRSGERDIDTFAQSGRGARRPVPSSRGKGPVDPEADPIAF